MTVFLLTALALFLMILAGLLIVGGAVMLMEAEWGGLLLVVLGCLAGAGVQVVSDHLDTVRGAGQAQVTVTLQGWGAPRPLGVDTMLYTGLFYALLLCALVLLLAGLAKAMDRERGGYALLLLCAATGVGADWAHGKAEAWQGGQPPQLTALLLG